MTTVPDVETQWITLHEASREIPCYLARPLGDEQHPAMLVIHDRWGISQKDPDASPQHIYETLAALAVEGYVSLCPDMFCDGDENPGTLSDERALEILNSGFEYLKRQSDVDGRRIGILGFCFGGRLALLFGTHRPELAAVVDFYGRPLNREISELQPEHPMDRLHHLPCPVLGLFGVDDHSIPAEQGYRLDAKLESLSIPHRVIVYEGAGHAFLNHKEPESYRPAVADAAWGEMRRFLADALAPKHLSAPTA